MSQVKIYARLEDDVKQVEWATKTSSWGESSFKQRKESVEKHEGRVSQGVYMVFKELIYKLLVKVRDKPYYKKLLPIGGDSKNRNQRCKCAYHEEKGHKTKNYRALKYFLDQLV